MKNIIIHFRDIRLRNNAGMDFPACYANPRNGLLDTDKGRLLVSSLECFVTCKRCKRKHWPGILQERP
jgi:hypothetical protein